MEEFAAVSVVFTNFNGRAIIGEAIDAAKRAAANQPALRVEIIVVDDCSTDGSAELIRTEHPDITLLALEQNVGYGEANNRGVKAASHDFVVILNSDMLLTGHFFHNLLEPFRDETVFALAGHILSHETGRHDGGCCGWSMHRGLILMVEESAEMAERTRISSQPGGGMVVRKALFEKLGGYSPMYHPFYWEDVDLGMRAWRSGYRVAYNPDARILHKHVGAIRSQFDKRQVDLIKTRNKYLFQWRHTDTSPSLRWRRRKALLWHLLYEAAHSNSLEAQAWWAAWKERSRVAADSARTGGFPVSAEQVIRTVSRDRAMLAPFDDEQARRRRKALPEVYNSSRVIQAEMIGAAASQEPRLILAVGCAASGLGEALVRNGNRVISIEADAALLERARAYSQSVQQFNSDDEIALALHDQSVSFDAIVFDNSLDYVRSPERILRKASTLLKPGGHIVLTLNNIAFWGRRWNLLFGHFEIKGGGLQQGPQLQFFTLRRARSLFKDLGLELEQTACVYRAPRFLHLLGFPVPFIGHKIPAWICALNSRLFARRFVFKLAAKQRLAAADPLPAKQPPPGLIAPTA